MDKLLEVRRWEGGGKIKERIEMGMMISAGTDSES